MILLISKLFWFTELSQEVKKRLADFYPKHNICHMSLKMFNTN